MSGPPVPAPAPCATEGPDTLAQCHCEAATIRIVNLCSQGRDQAQAHAQAHAQGSSPTSSVSGQTPASTETPGSFLSATLTRGRSLIRHWEQLNGCANAASHMDAQILQYMVDNIGWVLRDHEMAVDDMSRSPHSHEGTSSVFENDVPSPAAERNTSKTFVGNLELDLAEANIVIQEALSNSIFRLAVMLQDIEEETAMHDESDADYRLRLKDLTTRLFRLLGRVTSLETDQ